MGGPKADAQTTTCAHFAGRHNPRRRPPSRPRPLRPRLPPRRATPEKAPEAKPVDTAPSRAAGQSWRRTGARPPSRPPAPPKPARSRQARCQAGRSARPTSVTSRLSQPRAFRRALPSSCVRVAGRAARVLPADPVRPVGAVLALPDGDALLHAIDHEPARAERLAAMGSARGADHRDVADLERAHAVQRGDARAGDLGFDLGSNAVHLGDRHRRVGLVLERVTARPSLTSRTVPMKSASPARARVRDHAR